MKTDPTVSLAIIAKDEVDKVVAIREKNLDYFDEIHIAVDEMPFGLVKECGKYGKIFYHKYDWCDDFAHKRNFLADKITTDYYVTIDTDDELIGAENIRENVKAMERSGANLMLCWYNYKQDDSGNCILGHYKETIVKKDPKIYWKGKLHESVIADKQEDINGIKDEQHRLVRFHVTEADHSEKSKKRNIRILQKMLADEVDNPNPDPRTYALLGRAYTEVGVFGPAVELLDKHIQLSGWDEDRYLSYLYLAKCLEYFKKDDLVVDALFEAIKEIPEWPQAYAQLSEYYHNKQMPERAIDYGLVAMGKKRPNTNMPYDPTLLTWKMPFFLSLDYMEIGQTEKAINYFAMAKKAAPNDEDIANFEPLFVKAAIHYDYMKCLLKMLKFTKDMHGNIQALVQSIPLEAQNNQMLADLMTVYGEKKVWASNSIVFFCGLTPHMWGPESLAKGIGGSEEAMIHMGRELTKLGYEVTVYNNCVEEVEDQGVKYIPACKFNRNDKFNILVGWRNNITIAGIDAKKHVTWIHDLPNKDQLTEENTAGLDKVIVLSEYHKSLLPEHLRDSGKVIVSTNGLVRQDFEGLDKIEKEPKRIIYASSYDRGLEFILDDWVLVRKAHPTAELHVYYGWNTYDNYVAKGLITDEFKVKLLPKLAQDGVFEHGRIGHKELLAEYAKASVFAYPSNYKGEINCIALSKALATGCNIVTNEYAVLSERSPNAVCNVMFTDELIKVLDAPPKVIDTAYIESMSWENVAAQWHKEVF